jgi:hypothetical protein
MSAENRKDTRIYPKDFSDFVVYFETNGFEFKGLLGNISMGGLCAIMPEDFPLRDGSDSVGYLLDQPYHTKIQFQGKIVWTSDYLFKKEKKIMLGIEFKEKLELPERLEAITIAVEE